jgi:hypothetical protein
MNAWLYMDRLECPLGLIPEPLKEFCILEGGRLLHLRRDVLRDEAHLSLGTWLPFDESKPWTAHIERGRYVLSKLIPFLPTSAFRQIPSLLELTEMRGECIRRGQIERLQPAPVEESRARTFMRWIRPQHRETGLIARRVYSLSPHDLAFQNRMSSFEAALGLLDHFDERRKGLRPGSQF